MGQVEKFQQLMFRVDRSMQSQSASSQTVMMTKDDLIPQVDKIAIHLEDEMFLPMLWNWLSEVLQSRRQLGKGLVENGTSFVKKTEIFG